MLASLLSFLLLYKYFALFLCVFSVAIVVPLPINALLLATGAFASFGYFNLAASIAVAVFANVLGDVIDYAVARHYGPLVFEKFKVNKHYYFERLTHGVREHARLTIFITRFVGPLDLLVNLFAGSIKIPAGTFILYDFLGNFISNVLVLGVGYLAGDYWQSFSGLIDTAGEILLVAIVFFVVIQVFIRRHRHARALNNQNSADSPETNQTDILRKD